jgi:hypothetical protein
MLPIKKYSNLLLNKIIVAKVMKLKHFQILFFIIIDYLIKIINYNQKSWLLYANGSFGYLL